MWGDVARQKTAIRAGRYQCTRLSCHLASSGENSVDGPFKSNYGAVIGWIIHIFCMSSARFPRFRIFVCQSQRRNPCRSSNTEFRSFFSMVWTLPLLPVFPVGARRF